MTDLNLFYLVLWYTAAAIYVVVWLATLPFELFARLFDKDTDMTA